MANYHTDDRQELMVALAVLVIIGLYLIVTYISKAFLLACLGLMLFGAFLFIAVKYGWELWQLYRERRARHNVRHTFTDNDQ